MKKLPVDADALRDALGRIPTRVATVAAAAVIVLAGAYLILTPADGESGGESIALWDASYDSLADELAATVKGSLEPYESAADGLANNTQLRGVMREGDLAALDVMAEALRPALPGVLALRLMPPDIRDPDLEAQPPISFASISMIRSAREKQKNPPVEVHLAGTEEEHIVILRRVEGAAAEGDQPALLGFVHLSVSPNVVREAVAQTPPEGAFAEVRQGSKVRLAAAGNPPPAGSPSTSTRVPGTILTVAIMAPGAGAASASGGSDMDPTTLAAAAGLVVILVLIGVVLARRGKRTSGPSSDTVIFQGAIKAILEGAHPGLEQLLPNARAAVGVAGGAALDVPDLARADDEDVTTFGSAPFIGDDDPTVPGEDAGESAEAPPAEEDASFEDIVPPVTVPASIFRSYDIRGVVGETLTEEGVYEIGRALGAEADARDQKTVVVARDGRHSSEGFLDALSKGLIESGREVLDIGLTPTPVLYFATHFLDARSGVMITGSHNPAEYNGLKIVLDGETLSGDAIQAVRRRVEEQDYIDGTGSMQSTDIVAEYIRRISEEIPVTLGNALKVVVDCGNGVPGTVAPDVLRAIGHDVVELYCDVDGDFPNHHPDPSQPDNLADLIDTVAEEGADLGLAFDGDGDRLGVVDAEGNVIWPDRQMMLFAKDILSRNEGAKIIYDVKCSRLLAAEIREHGGEPIMSRTGHSLIKSKMQETGALLAGEMSGHIFFKERWYGFDDAIYSAARLMEIIVNSGQSPAELFAALPGGVATPELRLDMPEERHATFMQQVLDAADFPEAEISTIDGLRVDFPDAWGLVRASNTTPCLVLRFEGDDEAALEQIKTHFRTLLSGIDESLTLPF